MERLTTRIDGYAYGKSGIKRLSKDYHRGSFECTALIERLAEYEDLEEQGLLIRLPCKIGDTVYRICPKCNDNHNGNCEGCFWRKNKFGHGCSIYGYEGVKGIKRQIVPYKVIWGYVPNLIEHIGKHVFLTYEDAERKLKEMEEN